MRGRPASSVRSRLECRGESRAKLRRRNANGNVRRIVIDEIIFGGAIFFFFSVHPDGFHAPGVPADTSLVGGKTGNSVLGEFRFLFFWNFRSTRNGSEPNDK